VHTFTGVTYGRLFLPPPFPLPSQGLNSSSSVLGGTTVGVRCGRAWRRVTWAPSSRSWARSPRSTNSRLSPSKTLQPNMSCLAARCGSPAAPSLSLPIVFLFPNNNNIERPPLCSTAEV
jgi:hypothetical protein